MKLFITINILLCLSACKNSDTDMKDKEISIMIEKMTYANLITLDSTKYWYLIEQLRAGEKKLGHEEVKILFGQEYYTLSLYDTTSYRYRLDCEKYILFVNDHSCFPGEFDVMKRWDASQEKYHRDYNFHDLFILIYGLMVKFPVWFTIILASLFLWIGWQLKSIPIKEKKE